MVAAARERPWLPPRGSCPSAHTGADEECGRKSGGLQNVTDLLPRKDRRVGLICCTDFNVISRIPHPALRATLPRGEGMAAAPQSYRYEI